MAQSSRLLVLIPLLALLWLFSPALAANAPANLLAIRQRQVASLQVLADGRLPEQGTIEELFLIDVLDDQAVAERQNELKAAIATSAAASDALSEQSRLDLAADRARLLFLQRPLTSRRRLLRAEELLTAVGQLRAEAGYERDVAESDRQAAASDIGSHPETGIAVRSEQAEARLRAATQWLADLDGLGGRVQQALQYQIQADRAAGHDVLATRVHETLQRDWEQQAATLRRDLTRGRMPAAPGVDSRLGDAVWQLNLEVDVFASEAAYAAALRLLDGMPASQRAKVMGFGPVGWRAIAFELDRLSLAARWYPVWRLQAIRQTVASWRQPGKLFLALGPWLAGLAALVAASLIAWQGRKWLERPRQDRYGMAGYVWGRAPALAAYWPSLVALSTLAVLPGMLGRDAHVPEVALALNLTVIAVWADVWGTTIRLTDGVLQRGTVPSDVADKARRSLVTLGCWFFGALIALACSRRLAGYGVLHHHLFQVAMLAGVVLVVRLARIWRNDVAALYLALEPQGPCPDAVRRAQARWYGFAVSLAALAWHVVSSFACHTGRLLLGFPQVRRLLAFAFRQQVSRRPATTAAGVPESLRTSLLEGHVVGTSRQVDHFPEMERIVGWLQGHPDQGGGWIITGDAGIGKSTWLEAACTRLPDRRTLTWRPPHRFIAVADVIAALGTAIGRPSPSVAALAAALLDSDVRLVVVDDAHRLFLRANDGFAAWEALDDLMGRTRHAVAWFVAVRAEPFRFLNWYGRNGGARDGVVRLTGWGDDDVLQLMRTRTAAAGVRVHYGDLAGDGIERLETVRRFLGTDQAFARMLWEYADGCPAVALRAWVDSLHVVDGRITAGSLPETRGDELDGLEDVARFVLAGVVWHGGITLAEAVRSLRVGERLCRDALARLTDQGVLVDDAGEYRVRVPWLRAVLRYLRRQHLIV